MQVMTRIGNLQIAFAHFLQMGWRGEEARNGGVSNCVSAPRCGHTFPQAAHADKTMPIAVSLHGRSGPATPAKRVGGYTSFRHPAGPSSLPTLPARGPCPGRTYRNARGCRYTDTSVPCGSVRPEPRASVITPIVAETNERREMAAARRQAGGIFLPLLAVVAHLFKLAWFCVRKKCLMLAIAGFS